MSSKLEDLFAWQLSAAGLPSPSREYRFHPTRRWRFDFAWPDHGLALEIEGGVWNRGRHVTPKGFVADAEKYNAAALAGWRVLRVTGAHVKQGQALAWAEQALAEAMREQAPEATQEATPWTC